MSRNRLRKVEWQYGWIQALIQQNHSKKGLPKQNWRLSSSFELLNNIVKPKNRHWTIIKGRISRGSSRDSIKRWLSINHTNLLLGESGWKCIHITLKTCVLTFWASSNDQPLLFEWAQCLNCKQFNKYIRPIWPWKGCILDPSIWRSNNFQFHKQRWYCFRCILMIIIPDWFIHSSHIKIDYSVFLFNRIYTV